MLLVLLLTARGDSKKKILLLLLLLLFALSLQASHHGHTPTHPHAWSGNSAAQLE